MVGSQRLGEKQDYESFVEGNLKQLLSKEIMYIPVKQICNKFPEWLAIQEIHLPKEEYQRQGQLPHPSLLLLLLLMKDMAYYYAIPFHYLSLDGTSHVDISFPLSLPGSGDSISTSKKWLLPMRQNQITFQGRKDKVINQPAFTHPKDD